MFEKHTKCGILLLHEHCSLGLIKIFVKVLVIVNFEEINTCAPCILPDDAWDLKENQYLS